MVHYRISDHTIKITASRFGIQPQHPELKDGRKLRQSLCVICFLSFYDACGMHEDVYYRRYDARSPIRNCLRKDTAEHRLRRPGHRAADAGVGWGAGPLGLAELVGS